MAIIGNNEKKQGGGKGYPRLGDLLVSAGLITPEQLSEGLRLQKGSNKRLGTVLQEQGYITETELIEALQMQLGIEFIDLSKVNRSMENNRVTLHERATICAEANTASGFRIGELQTEEGSTLLGYMKKSRGAYYLLGCMNTNATLAGKIAPTEYRDDTPLGIIKEGTGTYTITGNDNYLSGSLRILEGRVLVMNDRLATESGKLRGALGAKASETDAVAFVFSKGVLGGTGSIGGMVDNYGIIEPGADGIGLLTLKNYKDAKNAHLKVHPASVLRFKVGSTVSFDQLAVDGQVSYSTQTENFSTSDAMPIIEVVMTEGANVKVGDEFRVMTAQDKSAGDWHFNVKASKYTWEVIEREEDGQLVFVLRLVMTTPTIPTSRMTRWVLSMMTALTTILTRIHSSIIPVRMASGLARLSLHGTTT